MTVNSHEAYTVHGLGGRQRHAVHGRRQGLQGSAGDEQDTVTGRRQRHRRLGGYGRQSDTPSRLVREDKSAAKAEIFMHIGNDKLTTPSYNLYYVFPKNIHNIRKHIPTFILGKTNVVIGKKHGFNMPVTSYKTLSCSYSSLLQVYLTNWSALKKHATFAEQHNTLNMSTESDNENAHQAP